MSRLDWVIVGGGPHGVCAARALRAAGAELKIVDPSPSLLHRWSERAKAVAMTYMRSPIVHHLDAHPTDLHHYLHDPANADVARTAKPYLRPSLAAFLRHSAHVVARDRLNETLVRGCVDCLRPDGECLVVEAGDLQLRTRRVLLATGSNRLHVPEWAQQPRVEGRLAQHVFESCNHTATDIVGGGISAVQWAMESRRRTRKTVRLWVRRPIDVKEFDTDESSTKARYVRWWSELDEAQRIRSLRQSRARGSVTPTLWSSLSRAIRRGHIDVRRGPPTVQRPRSSERRLILGGPEGEVESGGLTLATGFEPAHVDGWLGESARALDLPLSAKLPRLQRDMHWGRGVYVTGPLARLRLGRMAGNIVGARWATSLLPGIKMQPY